MTKGPVSLTDRPALQREKATRQLCAGAYLDRDFRDTVLKKVLLDPRHRVAPSYGFDVIPVVEHAKRAMVLDFAQQSCFAALLIGAWFASPAVAITVACALGLWWLAKRILRTAPEVFRLKAQELWDNWLHRSRLRDEVRSTRESGRELKLCIAGSGILLVIPVVAAPMEHQQTGSVLWTSLWLLAAMTLVAFLAGGAQRVGANRMFHAATLRPRRLSRRQTIIDEQQHSEFVVYRRPEGGPAEDTDSYSPPEPEDEPVFFVGSGKLVHRWLPPLAIGLLRPESSPMHDEASIREPLSKREYSQPPFETDELVAELHRSMAELEDWTDRAALPDFQVRHRIYVEEADLSNDRSCLYAALDPYERIRVINDPHSPFNHYLEMRTSASGELVTTVFLRVTVKGRALSFDFAACALTRLPKDYQHLEQYGESGWWAVARAALAAVVALPNEVARSWRLVEIPRLLAIWFWALRDRTLLLRRGSRIGTVFSLREEKAAGWDDAVIDEPTILDYIKIIELRLLRTVEDFLYARGVDISDFRRRAQTIINAAVLNMGRMKIQDSAVGPNAQLNKQQDQTADQGA